MTHRASSHAPTIVIGDRTTTGNASQSSSLDAAVAVVLRVIFLRRVTCLAPSRVAPASSHAVRTKHVPLSRSVTHVKEAPPREGSRVGVGKDGARGEGLGAPAGGPLIPDATAEARRSRVGSSPGYASSPAEPAATTEASATSAAAASDAREARMTSAPHPRPRHERDTNLGSATTFVGTEDVDIFKRFACHRGYVSTARPLAHLASSSPGAAASSSLSSGFTSLPIHPATIGVSATVGGNRTGESALCAA